MHDWLASSFQIVGAVLQLLGVGLAGIGYWKTWRDFAGDERFLDPVVELGESVVAWVGSSVRRLVRRLRPSTREVPLSGGVSVATAMRAGVRTQFPSLGDELETADALRALDARTRQLMDAVNELRDRLHDEVDRVEAQLEGLRSWATNEVERLGRQDRRVALGGIRIQSAGLLLIALGLGLQLLGSLLGS